MLKRLTTGIGKNELCSSLSYDDFPTTVPHEQIGFHLISCIKTTHQTTADRGHLQSRCPICTDMEENPALATWWPVNYQAAQTSPKTESWCRAKLPEICGGCGKWANGATHAVGREAAWHVPKTSKSSEGRLGYVGVHVSLKCV